MYHETTNIYSIINKELVNLQRKKNRLVETVNEAMKGVVKNFGFEENSLNPEQILKLMRTRCNIYAQFEKELTKQISSLNESKKELGEL